MLLKSGNMQRLFYIIHESDELLVINKPAGLVCHPTKGDEFSSLISRVRLHLGEGKPAHLVNRLDRETSGVVMVAKSDLAAMELRKIWESREVAKEYLAIVHGRVSQNGAIDAPLGKDEQSKVAIKDCIREDGSPSQTEFFLERIFERAGKDFSLLRVVPRTGRKHQIRIHLAHIGHAIVGDKLYGGDEDLYLAFVQYRLTTAQKEKLILENHALHAREVRFNWRGKAISFAAEPESAFVDFLAAS